MKINLFCYFTRTWPNSMGIKFRTGADTFGKPVLELFGSLARECYAPAPSVVLYTSWCLIIVRRIFFFVMEYESNMEVGLAAQNSSLMPATPCWLRAVQLRASLRSSRGLAVALAPSLKSCGALSSSLKAFLASALGFSFCVRSESSPNKAFKNVRFAHWDRRTAGPLTSR